MAGLRYRVNDLPIAGRGAFTPLPAVNPVASSYGLVVETAAMGMYPVAVVNPTKSWAPPISFDRRTQSSNVVPDFILPDQYVAYATNMGPEADAGIGMTVRRTNPLPVPAISGIYTPGRVFRSKKIGGRTTMSWPRAFQRWATTSGSSS